MRLREEYKIDPNAFLALFFGLMGFKPNYEAALYLYDISKCTCKNSKKKTGTKLIFIIAGKGSEVLPKSDYYIPLGFVKELDELLSLPDVIVLPHLPSFSGPHVKTTYAFLSKKPVIATEDAVKDMPGLTPREQYLPFELKNPDTLLVCLSDLYYDKHLASALTLKAFLNVQKFSWRAISIMHIKLYEQLLKNKRAKFKSKLRFFSSK